jgi:hypothetical protein
VICHFPYSSLLYKERIIPCKQNIIDDESLTGTTQDKRMKLIIAIVTPMCKGQVSEMPSYNNDTKMQANPSSSPPLNPSIDQIPSWE